MSWQGFIRQIATGAIFPRPLAVCLFIVEVLRTAFIPLIPKTAAHTTRYDKEKRLCIAAST
jgi:hypothetical protein